MKTENIEPHKDIEATIKEYSRKSCNAIAKQVAKEVRMQYLKGKCLHSSEKGVTDDMLCGHEVIVSLTSYGRRINEVYLAIESIMQGTVKPNHIVLWLAEDMKDRRLPVLLQKQKERGLEIEYCKDILSYKKLIPAMKKYPDAVIITVDDDAMYECDMVENMLNAYMEHPDCVSAGRTHVVKFNEKGELLPYMQWDRMKHIDTPSYLNFMTGVGGILYPPGCFTDEVFNEDVFLTLCKYADDVWFYAMLLLKGTKINKAFTHNYYGEDYVLNESPYEMPLSIINNNNNGITPQMVMVFMKYGILDRLSGLK